MKKGFFPLFKAIRKFVACKVLLVLISFQGFAQTTEAGERNKTIVQQYQERVNSGDAKGAAAYISKDMKNFGRVVGPEGIQRVLNDIFVTFPDWRMDILEMVATGDTVVVRYKVSGTHLGVGKIPVNGGLLVGVPSTGKRFEASHIHWFKMHDGKILEHYGNRDDLGMMQQLGLVPLSLVQPGDSANPGKTQTGKPALTKFHKMLGRSNGTWKGEGTMQFSPDAKPVSAGNSTLINTMAMDGLYQVSEIKGNPAAGMGAPWTGLRITGYDSARKVFTRAMIGDGASAGGVAMEGTWDEATKSITMPFKKMNPSTGEERNLKEVYKIIDENTEVLEIYDTDPKTKKEFRVLNVKWTRVQ